MDPTTFRMMSGATAPPVQITFTANSYNVSANETSTLSWNVLNSTSVSIDQGIGSVAASGSNGQSGNNVTRTYTLTAVGQNGLTYTASLTITWQGSPAVITFYASNYSPTGGNPTTLIWDVTNSTSVSIDQIGPVAAAGSTAVGPNTSNTVNYTLTAVGINGQPTSSSVTISWGANTCPWPPPWNLYFC